MANTSETEKHVHYADVLLPLPVAGTFTYKYPDQLKLNIAIGKRVIVQFGSKKVYTALVLALHDKAPGQSRPKDILDIVDDRAIVNNRQIQFWEWIASYYMAYPGTVMNTALPSALKLQSESRIMLHPESSLENHILDEKEQVLLEALYNRKSLSIQEASELFKDKNAIPLIKYLIDRSLITVDEEIKDRYRPKIESFVRLAREYEDESKLQEAFDQLDKRAFKQLQILLSYINLSRNSSSADKEVRRSTLVKSVQASYQQLNQLIRKGILEVHEKVINRLDAPEAVADPDQIILNSIQQSAWTEIKGHFDQKQTVLLHGITSSGKTEIYIKLIEQTLKSGKQVLYLLPEIALTTQIINRLRKYFGDKVGIYHSKYNEHEQVEVWNRVLDTRRKDHYPVVIGARSALFLPFSKLGLVIVDEEHDTSFKQHDPAPRYNARDCAVYLGGLHKSNILLGSATPAFESYHNSQHGKFKLVTLKGRYGDIQTPETHLIDQKKDPRIRQGKSHFSKSLLDAIDKTLKENYQVMLFQNRRGFSLRLECNECHHVPMCINCDISLTYHKQFEQMRCHYCGFHTSIPKQCPECGSHEVFMKGFGTEKLEEELSLLFPENSIRRMDLDSTRSRFSYQKIINEFQERQIDILIGTQMITKGLDFDHVNLVGIMNADSMINFPDFRSYERSFQLMTQVSGRAGRKHKRGHVFIQTYDPFHQVVQYVLTQDYEGFYRSQMQDRIQFKYPPYFRLIQLQLKHRDYQVLNKGAREFADDLRQHLDKTVLGPEYPLVSKIKNWYIKQILVKTDKDSSLAGVKKTILHRIQEFHHHPEHKSIRINIDVDPL
ncbi:MAG: primosomal protein N' [Bacteroidota bacterium]|nr:primosomal protein N' [Bacteroidota bacterium]